MGRANRLISYFAELILLSFENTENIKLKQKEKTVFTGLPLRDRIMKYSSNEKKEDNSISILALGGSQGAKIFTDLIPDSLYHLSKEMRDRLKIYQNCVSDDEVY